MRRVSFLTVWIHQQDVGSQTLFHHRMKITLLVDKGSIAS